jgi:hypothetical protein
MFKKLDIEIHEKVNINDFVRGNNFLRLWGADASDVKELKKLF